uniref:Nedd4 family interacting protein 1 n=3 Tax=Salmo TaxID=8028 RepID=A0A673WN35_SALTR
MLEPSVTTSSFYSTRGNETAAVDRAASSLLITEHRPSFSVNFLMILRAESPQFVTQQLPNEEEPEEVLQVAAEAPPPYSSIAADNAAYFDYKEDGGFPKPPSYNVATTLPSYDEAERTKAEVHVPLVAERDDDFAARDDFEDADQLQIGNDGIFMLTFFMAFLFNWIGFFLSFCLTTSAAGRYGAISGFGLSLIKWILIVRFSTYFPGYFDGQYWLWWVFLVMGFLLFLRGFINYAKIRKMADSFSTLPRTRVLFIY